MSRPTGEVIHDLIDIGDQLSDVVQEWATDSPLAGTAPPELVNLLGAAASVVRYASMITAQVGDTLTGIAVQASGT